MVKIYQNSLIKDTGIYTISGVLNAAIPFLLLPILTRYLSPKEYGIVTMFTLITTFVSPFIGLSVNGAIARNYYERDNIDFSIYVYNCIVIIIASTIIVSLLLKILAGPISVVSSFPKEAMWTIIIYSTSQVLISVIQSIWQVQKKALLYGVFINLQTIFNFVLSIIFVVVLKMNWIGRIYGQILSYLIFSIMAIIILFRSKLIKIIYDFTYIKNALKFGTPLIPHAISGTVISMTDRFFITNMIGLADAGIYSVGYQIGSIINLFANSFNNAYVPWLYEKLKKDDYKTKIRIVKFTYIYFILILAIALFVGLIAPKILYYIIGKSYAESSSYVIWVALGYAFNGMYFMVVNYIFYSQRTNILAAVTFVTAIVNIIINYIFIKAFGAIGAAQATLIVFFIKFILVWILSASVHKMPWRLIKNSEKINI